MRQRSKSKQGIFASVKGKKFIKEKAKSLLQMMEDDAMGWKDLPNIARMFFDSPTEAIRVLRKGSSLFRQTPIESFMLCAVIHEEMKKRLKEKKKLKLDPDYAALNRIVSDKLSALCSYINVKYENVMAAKNSKVKRTKSMTIDRQQIIDRCIERYRRLAIKQKRTFLTWYEQNYN
tara:strand:- start:113 stop:640 length:528 start_codon:yes stop_codon:yes gene_type:complete